MPGLMIFSATLRRTGSVCSAMKTTPMPPSPICCSSLYGPMTVPGRSPVGTSTVASGSGGGRSMKPVAPTSARSSASTAARSAASPPQACSR